MLTVTEDANGEKGLVKIPIREVLYLMSDKKINRVIVHTVDQKYYMPGTLKYWETCLISSGYKFVYTDRRTFMNAERVVSVSNMYKAVYFEENATRKSKKCEIAHHKYREVLSQLGTFNDRIQYI